MNLIPRLKYKLIDLFTRRNTLTKFDILSNEIQWKSREELLEIQNYKLRILIEHAYSNTLYYKDLLTGFKLKPNDFRRIEDLNKLPILNKKVIKINFDKFKALGYDKYLPRIRATSGSTGEAFHFMIDKETHSWVHAYMLLAWQTAGFNLGDPFIQLSVSSSKTKTQIKQIIFQKLRNSIDLSSFNLDDKVINHYLEIIDKVKPKMIYGYGSALSYLAKYILDNNLKVVPVNCAVTTGENLLPHNRQRIEAGFNCNVFDQYGVLECGVTAFECEEHKGYHLGMTKGVVEIVDDNDQTLTNGVGRIIATDLDNYAFPIIRYDSGDIGSKSDRICNCGRGFELLETLEGRTREFLTTMNGKKMHGAVFSYVVRDNPWINQYQIIQNKIGELQVNIVADIKIDDVQKSLIRNYLLNQCDDGFEILINQVVDIPIENNNKRHFVVSNIINL